MADSTFDFSKAQAAKAEQQAAEKEAQEKKDPLMGLPPNASDGGAPTQVLENQPAYDYSRTTSSEDPNGEYIKYTGIATSRTLTADDWKAVVVSPEDGGDQEYEWNALNQMRIAKSVFSDAQLTYLLRVDGRFALVKDNETAGDSEAEQDN